jgi:hypothetical protein
MKRLVIMIVAMLAMVSSASAISLSRARSEALYLTDKMAYELNLSDDQYNAAYEINLDYIMSVSSDDDIYGQYWTHRNREMSYVLSASQYREFLAKEYFYRPISWISDRLVYIIHNRYPQNRYYRSAPSVYNTYDGGNRSYKHSAYQGRTFNDNKNVEPRQQMSQQPSMKRGEAIRQSKTNNQENRQNNSQKEPSQTRNQPSQQQQQGPGNAHR